MTYTIKEIADMADISTRTLRYYDQIALLKPTTISASGYRLYGEKETDRLQQILLYRSLGLKLAQIQSILDDPAFNTLAALEEHQSNLEEEKEKINQLLATVKKTIQYTKGEISMNTAEKFEGFKKERLDKNEKLYGEEIREKYGEETIEKSNKKFMNLSKADFQKMQEVEDELFEKLGQLAISQDLTSQEAKEVYNLHKQWLMYSWPNYSAKAHKSLVDMYLADNRFADYYNNRAGKDVASLLHDAVIKYAKD
ncbi:MerR family transcriptional regulator [Tetragenococcus halophilus subsp. flandriensis]|uniref:MerR family transcriptional regulator n=1 Tax=Tetragenococcus halophilus TaxID=51669 RepID=UPI0023E9A615|nr:MerR family transcriptional regulator [Tetragenococcus halophilus]GMA08498.1 MerR family transcriptional regulator [Tetragenococcus halophilus subsp. flandriensis]